MRVAYTNKYLLIIYREVYCCMVYSLLFRIYYYFLLFYYFFLFLLYSLVPSVIIDAVIIWGNNLQLVTITGYFFNLTLTFSSIFFLWSALTSINFLYSHSICVHSRSTCVHCYILFVFICVLHMFTRVHSCPELRITLEQS